MAEQSESIKKAVVTLRQLSEEEKIRLQCEARERYRMDWQSSMRTSREQGRAEGRAEGENALKMLYTKLEQDGRKEEIFQALSNPKILEKLYKEYHIK